MLLSTGSTCEVELELDENTIIRQNIRRSELRCGEKMGLATVEDRDTNDRRGMKRVGE